MENIKLIKSECTTVIMPTLQNQIFSSISALINQSKKWVELLLAIIQPKFKISLYFFTLNMPTLQKITEFKSSRVCDNQSLNCQFAQAGTHFPNWAVVQNYHSFSLNDICGS